MPGLDARLRFSGFLAGLVEGKRVELVAGDVALVDPGRDVAEDPGAARAGEELQCALGHLVVVGAEVFQVPAARAGIGVADLDRPLAQQVVVTVREEGQGVAGVEAGGAAQALLVRGRDLESCRAEGPRIFLCRRSLSAWDSSEPGWAGSVNAMPY